MKNTKVVNLGSVRDLLAEWEKVRQAILASKVTGFQTTLIDDDSNEAIFLGGVYKEQPEAALSAILKASAARTLTEDPPLVVQPKLAPA